MRISTKFLCLSLIAAGLMILAFPGQLLAQGDKVELILSLSGYYYTNVIPGENKTLYLKIVNAGNKPITNIRLSSDKPKGWTVDFEPESISSLDASSHQAIDVNVVPDPHADKGDYTVTLIAEADQTRTVTSTTLRVENAFSLWQWVGVGVGVLVIAGFVILYLRFGRE